MRVTKPRIPDNIKKNYDVYGVTITKSTGFLNLGKIFMTKKIKL